MKLNRNYVTPFISLVFLVVGLSGILLFFHLFEGYIEVVHEYLGVFFVICAIFHILLNWKALKIHFEKGIFMPALMGVLFISVALIVLEFRFPPADVVIINKIIKAPIKDAFKALDINYEKASEKLKKNGISIEGVNTIEGIWINNDTDPEEVIDMIVE